MFGLSNVVGPTSILLVCGWCTHRRKLGQKSGRALAMASAEHELVTGVWEQSPQRGPGAEPLVRESGGQSPLKPKAL